MVVSGDTSDGSDAIDGSDPSFDYILITDY